ncbi:hypothetical protein Aab01nite_49530 [Paractinoplanes abujensis]|uniref:Pentapeptide repeat protein n=2 Tax=Paractinoplanes abujensis TaxID=882441 RepID=A0A7W7CV12_9ACTN|nr:pentapeptide repeat-containing protein [Actinoplanes abujensis]MBB4693980.1 hypothetical protein [Actinoplanes abujensis]GID21363.1 hypothetical protein Aab01nite_49530 [Actinoplanes abujensis]
MSSGTHRPWRPVRAPLSAEAAEYLQEWTRSSGDVFNAASMDLRGADLTNADFTEAWMSNAVLTSVVLREAELHRAHLESAEMTDADLTGANLTKASLDRATLHRAKFDDADLTSASLIAVDARSASFRRAQLLGGSVSDADFRGADLSDAVFSGTFFVARVDESSVVRGLTGSLYGPVTVVEDDGERELVGPALADWFAARGAHVEVLIPGSQP